VDSENTERLKRIEAKLDILIAALSDDEDGPATSLDGTPAGAERDQTQSL
jgi:hypothetical protein